MTATIGSAASPRWYDLTPAGLDRFIGRVREWGGGSTELLLHHGPSNQHIARFHVLEEDWRTVSARFIEAGIVCHVHAPLEPRFSLRRWAEQAGDLQREHRPVLQEAGRIADAQGSDVVVILHAANDVESAAANNAAATVEFLAWAVEEAERNMLGVRFAVELRHDATGAGARWDADRARLVDLVERVGSARVGICWDLAHDWENRRSDPDWTAAPPETFCDRVIQIHAHDAGSDEVVHYPLTTGRVPIAEQLAALPGYGGAITLEIRYRLAMALGDPIEQLEASYGRLAHLSRRQPVAG